MKIHAVAASVRVGTVLRRLRNVDPGDVLLLIRWAPPLLAVAFRVRAVLERAGELRGTIGAALRIDEQRPLRVVTGKVEPIPPETVVVRGTRFVAANLGDAVLEHVSPRREPKAARPPELDLVADENLIFIDELNDLLAEAAPALDRAVPVGAGDGAGPGEGPPGRMPEAAPIEVGAEPALIEVVTEPAPEPVATRVAYGSLSCPAAVSLHEEFEIMAGLAEKPEPEVATTRMLLPDVPRLEIVITLMPPPGCALREGESARNTLVATRDDPYPKIALHLRATSLQPGTYPLGVTFALGGEVIGAAVRQVSFGVAARPGRPSVWALSQPGGAAPDLTVTILQQDRSSGRLRWSFETPHDEARALLPDLAEVDIGSGAREFAQVLMSRLPAAEQGTSAALLRLRLRGVARSIAARVPAPFYAALGAIAKKKPTPSVLFLSQEPFVPWELMAVEPPLDAAAPPLLGAQADVGRWIFDGPPPLPAPVQTSAGPMAVLAGGEGLEQGEDEVFHLKECFAARTIPPSIAGLVQALSTDPPPHFVHVSLHGSAAPEAKGDGLLLPDGAFDQLAARGLEELTGRPFIFLNACEVGQGAISLGAYAGLAAAFTYVGASGVIAPLWAIRDGIARSVAVRFYRSVANGMPVAAALREVRCSLAQPDAPPSATYLAYQFFGHPLLTLALPQA